MHKCFVKIISLFTPKQHGITPNQSPSKAISLDQLFGSKTGPLGPNVAAKISPGGSVLVAKTDPPFKGIVRCAATNFLPFVSLYACLHWNATALQACICITPNCSRVIYRSMQLELPASTMHAVARRLLILNYFRSHHALAVLQSSVDQRVQQF